MPQLDYTSFFPEVIYFIALFLILLYIIQIIVLPKIAQTLKLRDRLTKITTTTDGIEEPKMNSESSVESLTTYVQHLSNELKNTKRKDA